MRLSIYMTLVLQTDFCEPYLCNLARMFLHCEDSQKIDADSIPTRELKLSRLAAISSRFTRHMRC